MKIGIFDSGIGGLSVLQELHKQAKDLEYFYISDEAYCPYGNKTNEQVVKRCFEIVEIFIEQGVDLIVLACNSATAVAIDELREKFDIKFVGVEPYINLLNKHSWKTEYKGVVLTTEMTGNSKRFNDLKLRLDPESILDHMACPELATIVETFYKDRNVKMMKDAVAVELKSLVEHNYSHIILGCTHYPLIKTTIEKLTNANTYSPCVYVAEHALRILKYKKKNDSKDTFQFMTTLKGKKWCRETFEIIDLDKL